VNGRGCTEINTLNNNTLNVAGTMVCPVEGEVTASHVNGRGCTEINTLNNNTSNIAGTMVCPVEGEVTTSHVNGRGCTEINTSNIASPTVGAFEARVLVQNRKSKKGFQHVYKSRKTTSSLRVHAAHKVTLKNGTPQNRNAMKRDTKKKEKLDKLKEVVYSPSHSLELPFLRSYPVFFSRTSKRTIPSCIDNSVILSATEDLHVIHTVEGARMRSSGGDTIFTLIP
jgi:hypothetical protein